MLKMIDGDTPKAEQVQDPRGLEDGDEALEHQGATTVAHEPAVMASSGALPTPSLRTKTIPMARMTAKTSTLMPL